MKLCLIKHAIPFQWCKIASDCQAVWRYETNKDLYINFNWFYFCVIILILFRFDWLSLISLKSAKKYIWTCYLTFNEHYVVLMLLWIVQSITSGFCSLPDIWCPDATVRLHIVGSFIWICTRNYPLKLLFNAQKVKDVKTEIILKLQKKKLCKKENFCGFFVLIFLSNFILKNNFLTLSRLQINGSVNEVRRNCTKNIASIWYFLRQFLRACFT